MKKTASFSLDEPILAYIQGTARNGSRSERVNELLERAIQLERYEQLEREAAEFFAARSKAERAQARAFQKASLKSIVRE